MARRDIELRDRLIVKLYMRGVARKQIAAQLDWIPTMSYEAVKKVLQKCLGERREVVRNQTVKTVYLKLRI